jgi:hypothetical protein
VLGGIARCQVEGAPRRPMMHPPDRGARREATAGIFAIVAHRYFDMAAMGDVKAKRRSRPFLLDDEREQLLDDGVKIEGGRNVLDEDDGALVDDDRRIAAREDLGDGLVRRGGGDKDVGQPLALNENVD